MFQAIDAESRSAIADDTFTLSRYTPSFSRYCSHSI